MSLRVFYQDAAEDTQTPQPVYDTGSWTDVSTREAFEIQSREIVRMGICELNSDDDLRLTST